MATDGCTFSANEKAHSPGAGCEPSAGPLGEKPGTVTVRLAMPSAPGRGPASREKKYSSGRPPPVDEDALTGTWPPLIEIVGGIAKQRAYWRGYWHCSWAGLVENSSTVRAGSA